MNYPLNEGAWQASSDTDKIPTWLLSPIRSAAFGKESHSNNVKHVFHSFSPDCEERQATIRLLKNAGKEACLSALPLLLDALKDQDESVRVAAAEAFGILEELIPAEALLYALGDISWNVRAAAAQSLGHMKGNVPIKYLTARLLQEQDEVVREAIVRTLGKQGDFIPTQVLVQTLRTDTNWLVREAAAWALGELGEIAPIQVLIAALQNDPDETVRAAAAKSLGKSCAPESEEPLLRALEDEDEDVRNAAGWALQQFDAEIRGRRLGKVCHFDEPPWSHFKAPSTEVTSEGDLQALPEEIFFTLAQFMSDKKGCVRQADVVQTNQGQILLMDCLYQISGSIPHETFLQAINNETIVEPIESALSSRDRVVQEAAERVLEARRARSGKDVLLVSFALPHPSVQETDGKEPLRVVMSGIGCQRVREKDTCVLDQIIDTWVDRVEEPLACEYLHDLTDLKIWYHSTSSCSTFQEIIAS